MAWRELGFSQKLIRLFAALGLSFFLMAMNGCEGFHWNEDETASRVREKGEVRVLILDHPFVYENKKNQAPRGLEHDLLVHFAETYGLKIRFLRKKTQSEIFESLRRGDGHLAAARLWISSRREGFLAGPVLEESHLSLFCQRRLKIGHITDLADRRILIAAKDNDGAFDVRLRQFVPSIQVTVETSLSAPATLRRLATNKSDCALLENIEGAHFARAFPSVEKVAPVTEERPLGWVLGPDQADLHSLLRSWFQRASRDDEIMRVQDRYRSGLSHLDRHDVGRFLANLRSKFPRYAKAFRESAKEHALDWQLVAAVAYQESHWNADARSFTGVRGLMQLTSETAAYVGIEDRTDPLQSIWGGAFYLRDLMNRMPVGLDPQERMALALAAYNAGLAHLRDAQTLAVERGLNPHAWHHLKTVFPLLEDPVIAATLPAGASRGRETVAFVERVRAFHSLFHILN